MSKKNDKSSSSGWTRLSSVIDLFRSSLFERTTDTTTTSDLQTPTDPEATTDLQTTNGPETTTDLQTTNDRIETDRAVVFRVLRDRNGRVKQSTLVAQTEWSASKVSRLLTAMEARGSIERVRVGREKVVIAGEQTEE